MSDPEVLHRTPDTFRSAGVWLLVGVVAGAVVGVRSAVAGVVVGALALVLVVRTLRAEVRLGEESVRIRGVVRTIVVPYAGIASVAAVRSGPGAGTEVVELRLHDGRRIRADSTGCAPRPEPHRWSDVDAMVAAIAERTRALQ